MASYQKVLLMYMRYYKKAPKRSTFFAMHSLYFISNLLNRSAVDHVVEHNLLVAIQERGENQSLHHFRALPAFFLIGAFVVALVNQVLGARVQHFGAQKVDGVSPSKLGGVEVWFQVVNATEEALGSNSLQMTAYI